MDIEKRQRKFFEFSGSNHRFEDQETNEVGAENLKDFQVFLISAASFLGHY